MTHLTITGHSTALFSTWIFIEEMRLLFDAGDGVMCNLQHKAGKIRHVAMSHADRDHVYGLMQLNHHAATIGLENVFYPAEAGFFKAMQETCYRFDRETRDAYPWTPVRAGQSFDLGKDLVLKVVPNTHMPVPDKSLGYIVWRQFRKLKGEYQGASQSELEQLGRKLGSNALTEPKEEPILAYSGDTGPCDPAQWAYCKLLFHEATFLSREEIEPEREGYEHSALPDVLRLAKEAHVETLVLFHFSSRYRMPEIDAAVKAEAASIGLECKVFVLPPGRTVHDLLAHSPVWPA